jgi:trimeric autotransporter adhesin
MFRTNSARPISGRASARHNLSIGTALGGPLALALFALPSAALAQDECGAAPAGGGTVTCSPDGNPYPNGVTYTATDDLTIVLEDGVVIDTSGNLNFGVAAGSGPDADVIISGGTNTSITTDADGAIGALGLTTYGDLTIDLDSITTAGASADGIAGFTDTGAATLSANAISTAGDGADGISAYTGSGNVTISAGTIATTGGYAAGVYANSNSGDISITADTTTTTGYGSTAIFAGTGADGAVTIGAGTVSTSGDYASGIVVRNETGAVSVSAGDVATTGVYSDAIDVGTVGTATVNANGAITTEGTNSRGIFVSAGTGVSGTGTGSITTTGDGSNAVDVTTVTGPIDLTIGDVSTAGALSGGVRAVGGTDGDVSITTGNVTTTGLDGSNYSFQPTSTAIFATAQGLGNVTVDAGDIATAGQGAAGVNATAATGDVSVVTGDVATTGDRADGVNAQSVAGDVLVSTGSVTTQGDGSAGIYAVASNGGVTIDAESVATAGSDARGIDAIGGVGGVDIGFGSVTVNGGGFGQRGISAVSTGGDVVVTGTDIVTAGQGATALYAVSDVGDVSITTEGDVRSTGRGGSGIYAYSGTGDVTVNAANVSTVSALEDDRTTSQAAIVATGANATVNSTGTIAMAGVAQYGGVADAVFVTATAGDAAATVNNVTSTGDGSRAVVVTGTGNALAGVNGLVQARGTDADAVVVTGDTARVTVGSGGQITSAGGNLITITSTTGSSVDNAGTLGATGNGFAIEAIGGPITINNSGSLSSDILLTAGDDRITNSGTFVVSTNPDFGDGTDVFANSGTVAVGRNATVAGTSTFTGLETFQNTGGLVDLRNGVAGDRLILPGTFAGSGDSRLGLDITFGSPTLNDRLVLGGAASGNTAILLNPLGGQAAFDPGNVILVQAGAASNADAFDLAGGFLDSGFVRNEVIYNPADFSFRLSGGPSDAAFRTLNYVEGARNLWLKSADVVSGQLRAQRDALWAYGGGEPSPRLWMQIHGSVETRENSTSTGAFGQNRIVNTGFEQDYFGGQLGFDFGGGSGDKGGFAVGVTGGYINSSLNFAGSPDRVTFDAANAGVYASYTSGNIFFNALGKYDYYWADINSPTAGFEQSFEGQAYGGRAEAGVRFGSDSFFIEPAASISYVKTDFDDFSVFGTQVNFDEEDGIRGRAGARVGGQLDMFGSKASFYLGGNYIHEFQGEDAVSFNSGGQTLTYVNGRPDDYGEALLGVSVGQANGISGFIEGSYIRSFSDDDFDRLPIEGAGGRAGLRIRF